MGWSPSLLFLRFFFICHPHQLCFFAFWWRIPPPTRVWDIGWGVPSSHISFAKRHHHICVCPPNFFLWDAEGGGLMWTRRDIWKQRDVARRGRDAPTAACCDVVLGFPHTVKGEPCSKGSAFWYNEMMALQLWGRSKSTHWFTSTGKNRVGAATRFFLFCFCFGASSTRCAFGLASPFWTSHSSTVLIDVSDVQIISTWFHNSRAQKKKSDMEHPSDSRPRRRSTSVR